MIILSMYINHNEYKVDHNERTFGRGSYESIFKRFYDISTFLLIFDGTQKTANPFSKGFFSKERDGPVPFFRKFSKIFYNMKNDHILYVY